MAKSALPTAPSQTPSTTRVQDQQGATPPVVARDRPIRKAKQMALEQKVWTSDLPGAQKRALSSSGTDKAPSVKPKKTKHGPNQAKSSRKGAATIATALDNDRVVNIPPRFARKGNVLLATDLDSSGDEEDTPLSLVGGARTAPKAPAATSTEKTTHVHDIQDPEDDGHSSNGDGSDDDADPEAHNQALAEMSESDDEVLASMETSGQTQALAARLAAEQPMWSKPKPNLKSKGKAIADHAVSESDNDLNASSHDQDPKLQTKYKLKLDVQKASATALSKTELHAQQERPVFKTPAHSTNISQSTASSTSNSIISAPSQPTAIATDDDSSASDSDFDIANAAISTGEAMASHDYHIVYPGQGGVLALKAQHPHIQDVLQAAITRLELEAARGLMPKEKYNSLVTRLIADGLFTKSLSSIPNQRISTFRRKIKEKSDTSVTSFFHLVSGKAQGSVEWLLPHLIYIYPLDLETRHISDGQLYKGPIIMNVLCESLFKGSRSFYLRNEDIFTSSLQGRDELEIPMVMLALVGAAIHASLVEWTSGHCVESNFSTDKYMDAYGEHMTFLEAIKRSSPLKYHTMMYKLFDEASGGTRTTHVAPLEDPAIAHLNLEAMEED